MGVFRRRRRKQAAALAKVRATDPEQITQAALHAGLDLMFGVTMARRRLNLSTGFKAAGLDADCRVAKRVKA